MGVPKSSGGSGLTRGKKFREIEFHEFFPVEAFLQILETDEIKVNRGIFFSPNKYFAILI